MRLKWFNGKSFYLEWWNPFVECLKEERGIHEVWVSILGLFLHLWGKGLFKRLGETHGRFVAIDVEMMECWNLQWARILVRIRKWKFPSSLQVVVGYSCFAI